MQRPKVYHNGEILYAEDINMLWRAIGVLNSQLSPPRHYEDGTWFDFGKDLRPLLNAMDRLGVARRGVGVDAYLLNNFWDLYEART